MCWLPVPVTTRTVRRSGSSAPAPLTGPIPSGCTARIQVAAVDGLRVLVHGLEAIDSTPVADVKSVLDQAAER